MFIQGNLQAVFDALYQMGAIDPVLKMDWKLIHAQMNLEPQRLKLALKNINQCRGDKQELLKVLQGLESSTVNYVALEVARELAEANDKKVLH